MLEQVCHISDRKKYKIESVYPIHRESIINAKFPWPPKMPKQLSRAFRGVTRYTYVCFSSFCI
jgi:hypothetical protein